MMNYKFKELIFSFDNYLARPMVSKIKRKVESEEAEVSEKIKEMNKQIRAIKNKSNRDLLGGRKKKHDWEGKIFQNYKLAKISNHFSTCKFKQFLSPQWTTNVQKSNASFDGGTSFILICLENLFQNKKDLNLTSG